MKSSQSAGSFMPMDKLSIYVPQEKRQLQPIEQ
jgi:hypothetical protein